MRKVLLPQLRRGEKLLVAFSGGLDSRILLELLLDHAQEWDLTLALFHLDHALRPSSADEAQSAREIAEAKGLEIFVERHDVVRYCKERGVGIEVGARDLRYERLRSLKEELGFDVIALGHHLDDNVETFFLHLLRGSSLPGLRGMEARRGDLYRPILSLRKKELEEIADERGIDFVIDESNLTGEYTRNRLRLDILPRMEKDITPALYRTIERTMERIRREDDYLQRETERWDQQLERPWQLNELRQIDEAIVYRLVLRRIAEARGSSRDISSHALERVVDTIHSGKGMTEIDGFLFLASQGTLYLVEQGLNQAGGYHPLSLGKNKYLDMELFLEETSTPLYGEDVLSIPKEMVKGSLHLRTRRDGDRFRPSGMKGSKKLKDFLIDEKIPLPQRDRLLLVCDEERIYWIVGLRKADIPKNIKGEYLVLHRLDVVPKEDNS